MWNYLVYSQEYPVGEGRNENSGALFESSILNVNLG
jgi:hypothetical protein